MRLIGAGYARTGTLSLKLALARLGFHTYHMEEAVKNFERGDLAMWNAVIEGRSDMDWSKLLEGYDSTADLPACLYYRELLQLFPEAKVILTVRDPEKWVESWASLTEMQNTLVERLLFVPRFREFQKLFRNVERATCQGGTYDHDKAVATFIKHNETVKATVPPDRLLVFEVKDGWKPLCDFLGLPVPDEEFPHENAGMAYANKFVRNLLISDLVKMAWPFLAGLVVIVVVLIYLLSR